MGSLLTVGQVVELSGVTVRTLHHYDEIGLLVPSARSIGGYRLYTDADLARLQQIVVYRRLAFSLAEIAQMLGGDVDVAGHLLRQRAVVMSRLEELHDLVDAINRALERAMSDQPATTEELKRLFGEGFKDEYQQEALARWGDIDAWKQSNSRTRQYTSTDWEEIKAEGDANNRRFVAALNAGLAPSSEEAMDAAEQHRLHIHRRFYDADHDFHSSLSDLYVTDRRFMRTYEDLEVGLAQYVRDAIHANAARQGA